VNLANAGFPLDNRIETVYCQGERPEWGADKTTRRASIAAHYRILLLFGDDLGDFISGANSSPAHRRELIDSHEDNWGIKWFILPNTMYGSWETSLYESAGNPTEQQKQRLKYEALRRMLDGARTATRQ
jgi:5'-nucleotidase (lipoprotein e(P4) family)